MVSELSRRRLGLPKFSCRIRWASNTYRSFEAPDGNSWLPVCPQPNRTFRLLMCSLSCINASLDTFHANASDGKFAYLLFSPNLVEPSRRMVPVNKYRSA